MAWVSKAQQEQRAEAAQQRVTATLSRPSSGGGPSHQAMPLGVCLANGMWMWHSGAEEEEEAVVYLSELPDTLRTSAPGALIVLRAAQDDRRADILLRARSLGHSMSGPMRYVERGPPPPPEAATAANASFACKVTSVGGAHRLTAILNQRTT